MTLLGALAALATAGSFPPSGNAGPKRWIDPRAMAVMRMNADTMFGLRGFEDFVAYGGPTNDVEQAIRSAAK